MKSKANWWWVSLGLIVAANPGARAQESPSAVKKGEPPEAMKAVRDVMEKYQSVRPQEQDLAIYRLDWAPTLKEAKARAAKEQRPIFLIVVTNSFGNMYTGHC